MRLLKPLIIILTLVAMTMLPVTEAFASLNPFSGLQSALSSEIANGPGVMNSPGHVALYGGNLSIHVPSDTVQFISISPPSFAAGCSGISMYFGGFSFISGASFGKLIQAIMQAAPGYVINLAIRTLCPECSDILTELQKLAQAANSMGTNACHIAKSLVNGIGGLLGADVPGSGGSSASSPAGESVISNAAKTSAGTGAGSGFFSEFNQYAGDVASALQTVNGYLNNPGTLFSSGGATKNDAAEKEAKYQGNQVWMALTEDGYANTDVKEIIMAMTGFVAKYKNGAHSATAMANPEDVVKVVEYGADPSECAISLQNMQASGASGSAGFADIVAMEQHEASENYENNVYFPMCYLPGGTRTPAPASTPMGSSDPDALQYCNGFVEYPAIDYANATSTGGITYQNGSTSSASNTPPPNNPLLAGYTSSLSTSSNGTVAGGDGCGILGSVALSLRNAVNNVATGKPMTPTELAYVQMAPFPLYQLINDASVYPSAVSQLVDVYSPLLAYLISRDVVLKWISAANSIPTNTSKQQEKKMNPGLDAKMDAIVQKLYASINGATKQLAVGMTVQEGIMAQIDEMNQMIAGQAAMAGMDGNMMFTQSLAQGVQD